MASWYISKIRYQKEDSAGSLVTINEVFLVDAVSFTEAESRAYKQIVTGASDFSVTSISRIRLTDLFIYDDSEKWWKAKVVYFSFDEKSAKEKRIVNYMLVNADSLDQANQRIAEKLRTMLIPYDVEAISLTPILDIFPYVAESDEEKIPEGMRPLSEVMAERAEKES